MNSEFLFFCSILLGIVSGTWEGVDQVTFVVQIQTQSNEVVCNGVLIDVKKVLTSAACVLERVPPSVAKVVLGGTSGGLSNFTQRCHTYKDIPHPKAKKTNGIWYYDLGGFLLSEPFVLVTNQLSALPSTPYDWAVSTYVQIVRMASYVAETACQVFEWTPRDSSVSELTTRPIQFPLQDGIFLLSKELNQTNNSQMSQILRGRTITGVFYSIEKNLTASSTGSPMICGSAAGNITIGIVSIVDSAALPNQSGNSLSIVPKINFLSSLPLISNFSWYEMGVTPEKAMSGQPKKSIRISVNFVTFLITLNSYFY